MALQYDGNATTVRQIRHEMETISLEAMFSYDTHYCSMSMSSDEEDIIVIW